MKIVFIIRNPGEQLPTKALEFEYTASRTAGNLQEMAVDAVEWLKKNFTAVDGSGLPYDDFPLEIEIFFSGESLGRCRVELELVPVFHATKIEKE